MEHAKGLAGLDGKPPLGSHERRHGGHHTFCGGRGLAATETAEPAATAPQPENKTIEPSTVDAEPEVEAPDVEVVAGFGLTHFDAGSGTLLFDGVVFLVTLPILWWMLHRPRRLNNITSPGFEIITDSEVRDSFPLRASFNTWIF